MNGTEYAMNFGLMMAVLVAEDEDDGEDNGMDLNE